MLYRLINERRWEELTGYLNGRLDLCLTPAWVERTALLRGLAEYLADWHRHHIRLVQRQEADILNWWKLRAAEEGLDYRPQPKHAPGIYLPVTLHVGFLCLEETQDMLLRLSRYEDQPGGSSGPATPGIERTTLAALTPVDRVAGRVVPRED